MTKVSTLSRFNVMCNPRAVYLSRRMLHLDWSLFCFQPTWYHVQTEMTLLSAERAFCLAKSILILAPNICPNAIVNRACGRRGRPCPCVARPLKFAVRPGVAQAVCKTEYIARWLDCCAQALLVLTVCPVCGLSCAAFHVLTNALCVLSAYCSALTSLTPTLAPSLVNTTFFFSILRTPRSASSFE